MSFETTLQTILDECGGGLGIALMGDDGIPVAQCDAGRSELADVTTAGVEFGRILSEIRKASDSLDGGSLDEAVISLSRFTLIFRSVEDDLFLVLALSPDGNLGKARYLMRRHLLAIREEL